jgi:23S rRNA (uracil1939-C5)-methyltransferase
MSRRAPREITPTIVSLESDGLGVGEVDERPVRIRNALPGETVRARVLKRRGGTWFGEAFEVDEPPAGQGAEVRVVPACPYFPRCGGCSMQHMNYPAQVALKERSLRAALEAQGVTPRRFAAPTLGPRFGYRSKARLGVRVVNGQVLVGFRESFSNRVGRMNECLVLTPALASLPGELKAVLSSLSAPERIPQVEIAAGDANTALIIRHLDPLTEADIGILRDFSRLRGVRIYGQPGGYDSVTAISESAMEPYLSYANPDFGLHYLFRPMDFTQVNMEMNRKLVRTAVSLLKQGASGPDEKVLDLFCGIGNFSLALAAEGFQVTGYEASAAAVERAGLNARRNGLAGRCEFEEKDLYDADVPLPGDANLLLLDPPRSGAGPNLGAWLRTTGALRVVYVSCSPASFAADSAVLLKEGFELEQVGIFDMFPHTAHVETLGVFQRKW